MSKKIMITDCYAMNTGDIAILMSMVRTIEQEIPDCEIIIESSHPKHLRTLEFFDKYTIHPRIFNLENLDKGFEAYVAGLYDSLSFLIWATLSRFTLNFLFLIRPSRRAQAQELKKIDILTSVGGGFLSSYYRYYFRLFIYSIALLLNKPVMIFAQSVGPFKTDISYKSSKYILNKVDYITIREPDSFEYVQQMKLDTKVKLTADIAFWLENNIENEYVIDLQKKKKPIVSICIKAPSSSAKYKNYYGALSSAIQYLIKNKYHVVLVSQTEADDDMGKDLFIDFKSKIDLIKFGPDSRYIKGVYSISDFIISSRMHAIIFAAAENVPFVCISYEPKFKGLMEQLSYPNELLLDEDHVTPEGFYGSIDYINTNRNKLVKELKKSIPGVKAKSLENVSILKELL